MMNQLKIFLAVIATSTIVDALWVGLLMSQFYKESLRPLLRLRADGELDPIKWAFVPIYLFIALGITYFVVPAVDASNWVGSALVRGALLGLVIYGVYEFTNYSIVRDWPLQMVVVDTLWGAALCAISSLVATWVSLRSS